MTNAESACKKYEESMSAAMRQDFYKEWFIRFGDTPFAAVPAEEREKVYVEFFGSYVDYHGNA